MRIEPRAIIFDYGNVLSAPQALDDVQAMADVLDAPVEDFVPATWRHRLQYDKAELSPTAYWEAVARDCSRTLSRAQIELLSELDLRSWSHPNPVMAAWAKAVRATGLRTAILSNMPLPMREYLDCSCPWLPEFDQRSFSCDVGAAKPMREIYAHCMTGLKVAPGEALFFDDRDENVRAAQRFGMHAILFTDAGEVACQLERSFSIPVPLRS